MKFGLRYCNTGRFIDSAHAVELIVAAEEAGFDSAWTVEHTVIPELSCIKISVLKRWQDGGRPIRLAVAGSAYMDGLRGGSYHAN